MNANHRIINWIELRMVVTYYTMCAMVLYNFSYLSTKNNGYDETHYFVILRYLLHEEKWAKTIMIQWFLSYWSYVIFYTINVKMKIFFIVLNEIICMCCLCLLVCCQLIIIVALTGSLIGSQSTGGVAVAM